MIDWLGSWFNWPFLFPLAVGVIFILLDVFLGGLSELIGINGNMDTDVDADADADAGQGHGPGAFISGLLWLGLGKVPISIVLETLFITFGVLGLLINALWSEVGFLHWLSFPVALVVALIGSTFCTRWLADGLAKILPSDSSISRDPSGFIGEPGIVVVTVTACSGQIRIEGRGVRPDVILNCKRDRTVPGDIPRGTQVVVMDYINESNSYTVAPMEEIG